MSEATPRPDIVKGPVMRSPSERRLRGALAFSFVVMPTTAVAAVFLARTVPDKANAFALVSATSALSVTTMFAIVVLVAALQSLRPVWSSRLGTWAWSWTLACCGVMAAIGLSHPSNQSLASLLFYATGMLSLLLGLPGLVLAAIPPRAERDFYGRKM